jgi:hypothetical protein
LQKFYYPSSSARESTAYRTNQQILIACRRR